MDGQMRVTPAELEAAAPTFEAAGGAVQRALSALRGSLPDPAAMCGSDGAGATFLASYTPRLDQVQRSISAIATGLPTVGTGLRTAAANVAGADSASIMSSGG